MRKIFQSFLTALIIMAMPSIVTAQAKPKYNYASQQKLIPAELGMIFMGMDMKAFSQKIKIDSAEAEARFEELTLDIPYKKGNIEKLSVKFTGLTDEQKAALVKTVKITEADGYEREVKRISVSAIKATGKLYEIDVFYKEGFDLKKYVLSKYGKPGDEYKKGDQYYIFDMQWTKVSTDKLTWLIRYHEETMVLQLAGLIPGSEWDVSGVK